MSEHSFSPPRSVLILIAAGFEESPVIYCLEQMREAGVAVMLVSVTAGLVKSRHGVSIRPDGLLGHLKPGSNGQLVVIPGDERCTAALLTEPRVYHLLKATLDGGGIVAATRMAQPILAEAGVPEVPNSPQFFPQGEMALPVFVERLMDVVLG